MYRPSRVEGRQQVLVRLSDVQKKLRVQVAETIIAKMIERGQTVGFDALELKLRAVAPVEDPVLWVDVEKADRVLREHRVALGETPWDVILG